MGTTNIVKKRILVLVSTIWTLLFIVGGSAVNTDVTYANSNAKTHKVVKTSVQKLINKQSHHRLKVGQYRIKATFVNQKNWKTIKHTPKQHVVQVKGTDGTLKVLVNDKQFHKIKNRTHATLILNVKRHAVNKKSTLKIHVKSMTKVHQVLSKKAAAAKSMSLASSRAASQSIAASISEAKEQSVAESKAASVSEAKAKSISESQAAESQSIAESQAIAASQAAESQSIAESQAIAASQAAESQSIAAAEAQAASISIANQQALEAQQAAQTAPSAVEPQINRSTGRRWEIQDGYNWETRKGHSHIKGPGEPLDPGFHWQV